MTIFTFYVVDGATKRAALTFDDALVSMQKLEEAIMQLVRNAENCGQIIIEA